ncbi:MAG: phosphohydrolase [Clostridiales bacterium]|nr:phosphohydrolase [Clostridiales bacterium]
MRIFAISDLHLPGGEDKPMDLFGAGWSGHFEKISNSWKEQIGSDDIVLLPGDHSWAMQFEAAMPDILSICALPGHKIFLKGNHDYWWPSVSRLREALPKGSYALQNDSVLIGDGIAVAGSRGWDFTGAQAGVLRREVIRMELSLKDAKRRSPDRIIVMMHYPPFDEKLKDTEFVDLFKAYGVDTVVYGHLHGPSCKNAKEGTFDGITYHLVSCDHLRFAPKEI